MTIRWLICACALLSCASISNARSVREFGAVGDGKADDAPAIQKAIDAGAEVEFPKGVYRLSTTIVVDLDKVGFASLTGSGAAKIVMCGKGPAFHFIGTHGGTADPPSIKPNVWERQRMPIVRGLEITSDNAEADGIEVTGVMQFTIAECLIRRCRHAIHLTTRDRNIIVANCHLYDCHGVGVYYDHVNLHQSNIVGCHISYCTGGGVVTRGGQVRNIQIGTCDIESNMGPDVAPSANVLLDSTDGSTDEVAITGCTLQHNDKSPNSANIRVIGKGITGEKNPTVTQEGHVAIVGNAMSDVRVNVHLQHARGVSIVGNTFWEGFDHDLLVEDSQAIVVGPNDFDRNPRYVVNGHWSQDLNGLVFRNCQDCKLNGTIIKGVWKKPAAVVLEKCTRCTVTDLSILDCDNIGLLMEGCIGCKISDCVIRDDRAENKASVSLKLTGGKNNTVRDNDFANAVDIDASAVRSQK